MRPLPVFAGFWVIAAFSGMATGCAQTAEPNVPSSHHDRDVVAVADRSEPSFELTTSAPPPIVENEASGRPRLSHVVTLGQGTADAEYYGPDGAPRAQQGPGPSVVNNNNVNVGGGGYGYGGYYGGYVSGYGTGSRGSRSHTESSGYAPTGWEGAGRTAGQGQTPGVGGNFPAAPSYGPRQAK